jgi:hypothetical protein
MTNIILCGRCGQEGEATISMWVCDDCRLDTKEFAKETEEHKNESKGPLTVWDSPDTV